MSLPAHHDPAGGFRDPWRDGVAFPTGLDVLRWQWDRLRRPPAADPPLEALPRAAPDPARPREEPGALRMTHVGHATTLLQVGVANILTDPMWSRRASPVKWAGPARLAPPGLPFDELPPVDVVLLSHDHFDHLDAPTVERLAGGHPAAVWVTPLGYRAWLAERGVARVVELDWWQEATLDTPGGALRVTGLPARHWTRRSPGDFRKRLWCAFAVAGADGQRVFFGGDSGWMPEFGAIGERAGPFRACLLPIGAYAPRWFMRSSHMTPEEAVTAFRDMGGEGWFVGIHWGVFRLADDPVLEGAARARTAWLAADLPPERLWLPAPGATLRLPAPAAG